MSYQGASQPALVIRHTGQVFALTKAPITIGRTSDNDIILADPQVSRRHATLYWQSGSYYVRDLSSANGTYVDEQRLGAHPVPVREGSTIRLGNTILDVQVAASGEPTLHGSLAGGTYRLEEAGEAEEPRRSLAPVIIGLLLGGIFIVGLVFVVILALAGGGRAKPTVTIQSPLAGSQITAGTEIILQATATGARNITRLEISVDGVPVALATSSDPRGQASLTARQPWTFGQAGAHVVSAVAYTARGRFNDPVSTNVNVAPSVAQVTPSATPETPAPTATASTTPLPTVPPPTSTPTDTLTPEPVTDTPTPTSTPTDTPTPTPSPTHSPPPQIAFFQANPATIVAGGCTTLEWGAVSNATEASIDQDIGGIATPGSRNVCPTETTTYVLTATGPGGTSTASATVTVSAAQPDLIVQSITFVPSPPVQGQAGQVQIAIRNVGTADAGTFAWQWQPGTETPLTGSIASLRTGETVLATATWNPPNWYTELTTIARVDTGNTVAESNESNNQLAVNTEVVASGEATISQPSQPELDGFWGNNGQGDNTAGIRVGNGNMVGDPSYELILRGFLSFDLSAIPAGATIQSAELRFYQQRVNGNPYGKLGDLLLKHVDFGSSLSREAYDVPAFGSITLAVQTSAGDWYSTDAEALKTWIEQDRAAGRTYLELRLQFAAEADLDGQEDTISIESGENWFGTGNVPVLTITYTP